MDAKLLELVDRARSGEAEAFSRLVDGLRALATGDGIILREAARSPELVLRRAAARVVAGRQDGAASDALTELVRDGVVEVRKALAEALAAAPGDQHNDVVAQLLQDDDEEVRFLAVQAARQRPG